MSKQKPSFSKAYQELQAITQEFETEDIDLEASIPKFKRAAVLVKFLKSRLSELESEIQQIDLDQNEANPNNEPPADS
jgi:exodeoxyribonuclease VII small subunit